MNQAAILNAADQAIARADALTFAAVGKPQTDAAFVAQWTADSEAAEACRAALKVVTHPYDIAHYKANAELFEAWTA